MPKTAVTESTGRGVLDAPPEAGHDGGGVLLPVIARGVGSDAIHPSNLLKL